MGAVVNFANTNFPDTNADGSPFSPSLASIRGLATTIEQTYATPVDLSSTLAAIETETQGRQQQCSDLSNTITANAKAASDAVAAEAAGRGQNVRDLQAADTTNAKAASDALAAESAARQQDIKILQGYLDTEEQIRDSDVKTLQANIDQEAKVRDADVQSLQANIDEEVAAAETRVGARIDATNGALALIATCAAPRPGDAPAFFGLTAAGGDQSAIPAAPVAGALATPDGTAYRLTMATRFAPRHLFAVEPGRIYRARAVVRRIVDTPDPIGDGVQFGVAFFDAAGALLSTVVPPRCTLALTVADGLTALSIIVAGVAQRGVDLVAPAGALTAKPFLETFGITHQTDVTVLSWSDISDAGLISPDVDALSAAVVALKSQVAALSAALTPRASA